MPECSNNFKKYLHSIQFKKYKLQKIFKCHYSEHFLSFDCKYTKQRLMAFHDTNSFSSRVQDI